MVYEFAGDEANAYTFYQRAAHADPKLADAQLLLGNAQMRSSHYAEATEHYRQLAALAPDNIEAMGRLVASQVAAGRCGDALAQVNGLLAKRAQDGNLMQIFVRLASTCAAAKPAERNMALDYARALYKQRPDAGDSAALALAFAAQGKFDEAQKSQAAAIYEAVRAGNTPLAQMYRATMRQFAANQVPDRPWPADHPYFKPPRLQVAAAAAPPAAK
jgi:Flp pilus assembly protein TadD